MEQLYNMPIWGVIWKEGFGISKSFFGADGTGVTRTVAMDYANLVKPVAISDVYIVVLREKVE